MIKFVALAAAIWGVIGAVWLQNQTDFFGNSEQEKDISAASPGVTSQGIIEGATEFTTSERKDTVETEILQSSVDGAADLNHDGKEEGIDIAIDYETGMVNVTISDEQSETDIYYETSFNMNQETCAYYIYNDGSYDYLICYRPRLEQSETSVYEYEVFYLDEFNNLVTQDSESVSFETFYITVSFDIDKMTQFYNNINQYLAKSYLLVGNIKGEIQYSDNERILDSEEYDFLQDAEIDYSTCKDISEKLGLYYSYQCDEKLDVYDYNEQELQGAVLTLEADTLTLKGADFTFTVMNSEKNLWSGEAYWLEKYDEATGTYVKLDTIQEKVMFFGSTPFEVSYDSPSTFHLDWSKYYGSLMSGKYRLGKYGSMQTKYYQPVYCEFEIQ
jgi:hypothetical protein